MPSKKEALWEAGREIVLAAPQLYVDVDLEADGIAGFGSILSIGMQSPTGESFYSEVRPYDAKFIPGHRHFCEEHGLERDRLLREAPLLSDVVAQIQSWLTNLKELHGTSPVFTAFNASFDFSHVDLAFALAGQYDRNPFGYAPFDLKSLAQPFSGTWDFRTTKKSALPTEIVPDGDFTHNALEDAQYQQKLHFGMAALLGRTQYSLLI